MDHFSKCHQIRSFLRIRSHLLENPLMENFIFCAVKKNKVNENENLLIEFCELYNLLSTNTTFEHRPSHKTTWISPLPPTFPRKNLYRNQIDYILSRKNMNSKIFDSRSFNSNIARPDYKSVIAKIQIKWTYMKNATGTKSFNLSNLQNTQIA